MRKIEVRLGWGDEECVVGTLAEQERRIYFEYDAGLDRNGAWRLAPAYDLVFSYGPGGQHTMAVAGEAARPTERDMLRVGEECALDRRRSREIINDVRGAVQQWPRFANETGVSAETARQVQNVIAEGTQ